MNAETKLQVHRDVLTDLSAFQVRTSNHKVRYLALFINNEDISTSAHGPTKIPAFSITHNHFS